MASPRATFYVLTESSTIDCGHGGKVDKTAQSKLMVAGKGGVLIKSDVSGKSVSPACTKKDPNKGEIQCSICTVTQGEAGKLTVGGFPVLLESLQGTAVGTPGGTLKAQASQTKLTAS